MSCTKKKIEIDSSYYLRHGVVHCENGSSKLYEEKKWNTFGSSLRKKQIILSLTSLYIYNGTL